MPRIRPDPFTKRLVERTGIGKSQSRGNFGKADLRFSQPHDRQLLAHAVLEPLIALAFFRQAAAQGRGGDTVNGSKALGLRPSVGRHLPQVVLDAAAGSLIAYMLQDHKVTRDELFAAGATFTLLAWAFAFAFAVCQQWYPGSFVATSESELRTWMELLYLSFSLLSGVGLSDVVPVHPQARALVMLEQFAGVMYVALVVSRLVGLTILKRGQS